MELESGCVSAIYSPSASHCSPFADPQLLPGYSLCGGDSGSNEALIVTWNCFYMVSGVKR